MTFTKQHSNENKAMKTRVIEMLTELGYSYESEIASRKNAAWGCPYLYDLGKEAAGKMRREFDNISNSRIKSVVSSGITTLRSQAIKRKSK